MSDKDNFLLILGVILLAILVFNSGDTNSGFANQNNAMQISNVATPNRVALPSKKTESEEGEYDEPVSRRRQIRELLNAECKRCGKKVNNRCKTACSQYDPRLLHHMQDADRLGAVRAIRLMCEGDHRGDYEAIDNCKQFYQEQYDQLVPES